jgi:thiamine-phosphate pyrophosphorylase
LPQPPLLAITDRRLSLRPLPEQLQGICAGGCRWVMVREKDLGEWALEELVRDLRAELPADGLAIIVNGAPKVAARCGLAGVHLPQGHSVAVARDLLGEGAMIGVSVHDEEEMAVAERDGADYVTLSPLFTSTSKGAYKAPLGLRRFAAATAGTDLPVLALGGVTAATAGACRRAGAAGLAVLGPLMAAADAELAVREILAAWEAGRPGTEAPGEAP